MTNNESTTPQPDDNMAMLTAMVPPPGAERTRAFSALLRAITDDGAASRGGR